MVGRAATFLPQEGRCPDTPRRLHGNLPGERPGGASAAEGKRTGPGPVRPGSEGQSGAEGKRSVGVREGMEKVIKTHGLV